MGTTYEYKFVRLGDYRGSAWFGVSDKVRNAYEDVVDEHARDGWRLVQIFAPGVAAFGAAKYYELIFERERAEDATAPSAPAAGVSVVQQGHEVGGRSFIRPRRLFEKDHERCPLPGMFCMLTQLGLFPAPGSGCGLCRRPVVLSVTQGLDEGNAPRYGRHFSTPCLQGRQS